MFTTCKRIRWLKWFTKRAWRLCPKAKGATRQFVEGSSGNGIFTKAIERWSFENWAWYYGGSSKSWREQELWTVEEWLQLKTKELAQEWLHAEEWLQLKLKTKEFEAKYKYEATVFYLVFHIFVVCWLILGIFKILRWYLMLYFYNL